MDRTKGKIIALSAGVLVFALAGLIAFLAYEQFSGPGARTRQVRVPVAPLGENERPNIARNTTMGDEHEAWAKVPPSSPRYATAQRLLGYNYFALDKHDLKEAKRHVDLALSASPNDPKVLEDAGRVYILAGLTDQGRAMLKKADTRVARNFLAHH